jgi:hypothetical protein
MVDMKRNRWVIVLQYIANFKYENYFSYVHDFWLKFLSHFVILMLCCDCELSSVFIDGRIRLCFNYFVNLIVENKFCVLPLKKEQNDFHTSSKLLKKTFKYNCKL